MTDTQAQEAARLAEWLEADACDLQTPREAAALLRSQAARIAELEKAHAIAVEIGAQYAADREALAAELARMREPLSDEWIRARCKESWVFDTARKWVRAIEAAHGITKTGGGV